MIIYLINCLIVFKIWLSCNIFYFNSSTYYTLLLCLAPCLDFSLQKIVWIHSVWICSCTHAFFSLFKIDQWPLSMWRSCCTPMIDFFSGRYFLLVPFDQSAKFPLDFTELFDFLLAVFQAFFSTIVMKIRSLLEVLPEKREVFVLSTVFG